MSERLRLRIEGDGTIFGTKVYDLATGRILPVTSVTFAIDAGRDGGPNVATATIVVPLIEIAVDALAEINTVAVEAAHAPRQ